MTVKIRKIKKLKIETDPVVKNAIKNLQIARDQNKVRDVMQVVVITIINLF